MYRILKYMRPEVDEIICDNIHSEIIAKLFLDCLIDTDLAGADTYRIDKYEKEA